MVLVKNIKNVAIQNTAKMIFIFLILLFILFAPLFFLLLFFNLLSFGFEKLGISPEITFLILFLILIGSFFNIPLSRKRYVLVREPYFFGLFWKERIERVGIFINLGGAVIPLLISFYFLLKIPLKGVIICTVLMTFFCYILSRPQRGVGVILPAFIPPIFSALFSLIFSPQFSAPTAFVSGVFGTILGADILNLPKVRKWNTFLSIGGAGVFDGIFLVAIFSAILA